jgi:hypothetical protein
VVEFCFRIIANKEVVEFCFKIIANDSFERRGEERRGGTSTHCAP